ncbi:hypothetical protein KNP414_05365 [Paenibacillus mucilaginosus KNP414]|uniref:Uncharacterized protein n=1 Tax=Paenibacillus mucilaginosus (strain KNP414) TaxID=1036673 RepID=F8FG69_PAEMK|nr:hypothetical protein KNP414_05365 [Paenibacillus mucilaginosus KNP414]
MQDTFSFGRPDWMFLLELIPLYVPQGHARLLYLIVGQK